MTLDWQSKGSCVGYPDPDAWYDIQDYPGSLDVVKLKAVCAGCPVRDLCFEWGLAHEVFGVWGGLTPKERQKVRRSRGLRIKEVA